MVVTSVLELGCLQSLESVSLGGMRYEMTA